MLELVSVSSDHRTYGRAEVYPAHLRLGVPWSISTALHDAGGKGSQRAVPVGSKSAVERKPLEGDIEVSITLYFGTKRKADLDNFNKLSLDALTGIVWEDDSQIADMRVRRAYDKQNPRIDFALSVRISSTRIERRRR